MSHCPECARLESELREERALSAKDRVVSGEQIRGLLAELFASEAARESVINDAILIVGNVRRHYPVLMNNKYADVHEALAKAVNRLVDLRSAGPANCTPAEVTGEGGK